MKTNSQSTKTNQKTATTLKGKTIKKIDCSTVNYWVIHFTDKTSIAIEVQSVGVLGLHGLFFYKTNLTNQENRS
jgi:hypothetical protein